MRENVIFCVSGVSPFFQRGVHPQKRSYYPQEKKSSRGAGTGDDEFVSHFLLAQVSGVWKFVPQVLSSVSLEEWPVRVAERIPGLVFCGFQEELGLLLRTQC